MLCYFFQGREIEMDNLRKEEKGKDKIRGIYIGFDREGRVPLLCNCDFCKKQRRIWGEKPVAKIEYVSVKEKVKELADNNINLILAFLPEEISYPSLCPPEKRVSSWNKDPFQDLIDESHRNNIQVYPIVYFTSKNIPADWYMTNAAGKKVPYGDPGNYKYREFLIESVVNLVKKYDVDGISLDYIRYVEMELTGDCCYCDTCRKNFKRKYGFDPIVLAISGKNPGLREQSLKTGQYLWDKERNDNCTIFVRDLKKAICETKKEIKLSSYVWGTASRLVFQNWSEWIENKLLDWVNPSGYDYDLDSFKRRCIELAFIVNKRCPLYITLGQHTSHGKVKNVEELIEMMKIARETGFDGFVLFTHSHKVLSSYLPSIKRFKF